MSVMGADLALLRDEAAKGAFHIRVDNYMDPSGAAEVLAKGPFDRRHRPDPHARDQALYGRRAGLARRGPARALQRRRRPGPAADPYDKGVALMKQAKAIRAQVAMHAIGDRGNRLTLDWFQEALAGDAKARWRIEHAQIVSDTDLPRFAKLGVIASMQPSHAIGDLYFAPARLGQARLHEGYRWKDFLTAARGRRRLGRPGRGRRPAHRVLRRRLPPRPRRLRQRRLASGRGRQPRRGPEDADLAPAYAVFREKERGTLEAGKKADVTAFDKDLMTVEPKAILTATAVLTVVDGKVVFERP
jgi:predicted amidohydrolase YtcJ